MPLSNMPNAGDYSIQNAEEATSQMKIFEFQNRVKDALNGLEELVQGGCRAFAEDAHGVYDESAQWVSGGKVALVVVTPEISRSASPGEDGGIPVEGRLLVRCVEKPSLVSRNESVVRALDAAESVAHALDGDVVSFSSIRQFVDKATGILTATAEFDFSIFLTK